MLPLSPSGVSSPGRTISLELVHNLLVPLDGLLQDVTGVVHYSELELLTVNGVDVVALGPYFGHGPRVSDSGNVLGTRFLDVSMGTGDQE